MDSFNGANTSIPQQVDSNDYRTPAAPTTSNAIASSSAAPRIRRRNRMIASCLECRRRKLKCNRSQPCTNCLKFSRDCVFLAPALDQASQLKLIEIKEKVGSLERLLERDVAKPANPTSSLGQSRALPDDVDDNLPPNEDEKDLEPTPLAAADAFYDVDGDDDELLDLGIQLGRMRITERIGGFFRPKISQELAHAIMSPPGAARGEPGSQFPLPEIPPAHEWLKPGPAYISPSPGFFFGQAGQMASLIDFLPSRLAADRLINQYFVAVHPVAQILHRPSFENEYRTFWDEVSLGIEPRNSVQAIVFAAMFAGVVSMDPPATFRDFGVSKESLTDNLKLGTETALHRANLLRTTKTETLQAFVLYLITLCRAEISRAHSVLVGAAIRMAECMGLHRDGEYYDLSPVETHTRRLIWHQLCFLDIRTCEAQGPRPTIRHDDFDTKLPLNVNDVDIHNSGKPLESADRWTDATFSLIRFELTEMNRIIWVDRPRVEQRKTSLTAVLTKIEKFRQNMTKYDKLMDERIPIQRCAKIVKTLLIARLHVMLLHSYHNGTAKHRMPDRLRQIIVTSGIQSLECAIALETLPELQSWEWYSGSYQQYHTAFLLLVEVYVNPDRKEADRIWPIIDYVFGTEPYEPRTTKSRKILSELQQKTAIYASMRGMRAPTSMNRLAGEKQTVVPDNSSSDHHAMNPQISGTSLSLGKVALSDAAVSDVLLAQKNEAPWTISGGQSSPDKTSGAMEPQPASQTSSVNDDIMSDIDWAVFDELFPPDQQFELDTPFWPTTSGP